MVRGVIMVGRVDGAGRPIVLLSNDDGYPAPGLATLFAAVAEWADTFVCAPEQEHSGTSHAITLGRPLRLQARGDGWFSLNGTPADCVYVALHAPRRVLPRTPDLVIAGLNNGTNLGTEVVFSGTVAAARQAVFAGVPALAASCARGADFVAAARAVSEIGKQVVARGRVALLNVNVPRGETLGVRATCLGKRTYRTHVEFRLDPYGNEYLWPGSTDVIDDPSPGTDAAAHADGYITVTPIPLTATSDELAAHAVAIAQHVEDARASSASLRSSTSRNFWTESSS